MSASTTAITDDLLPGLSAALDPERLTALLHEALGASAPAIAAERVVAIEVLKHKPGRRCALAIRLDGEGGDRKLFAKIFRSSRGASIYGKMAQAAEALSGGSLRVPKPIAYLPARRMLITEFIEGRPMSAALQEDGSEAAARRMAAAIKAFHGSRIVFPESWTVRDEIDNTRRWVGDLEALEGAPGERAGDLLGEMARWAAGLPAGPMQPIHRDFYPEQLLDCGDSAALLDLDDARMGDPALDLGNCMAHLTLRPLQFPDLDRGCWAARVTFLDEYLRLQASANDVPMFRERVRFYEGCSLLRLSGVYAARPRWAAAMPPVLLDACEVVLRSRKENT